MAEEYTGMTSSQFESEDHLSFYTRWNALAGPYFRWQLSQFQPYLGRRIADLGCGVGNFAQFLLDRELYLGIDMDPEMIQYMESEYSPERCPNVEIAHADVASPNCLRILKERNIDTILSVNVLEHIEDDISAINLMVEALPKGGSLCLLVPAFGQLYGTLDQLDNHYRRYNKAALVEKLDQTQLHIITLHYFNLLGAFGWFLKGRILKQTAHTNDNFRIMNYLSRYMKVVERAISIPFGLSLVMVARKF